MIQRTAWPVEFSRRMCHELSVFPMRLKLVPLGYDCAFPRRLCIDSDKWLQVNCYTSFENMMPFGGYKQSGNGKEFGLEAVEEYVAYF